MHSAVTSAIGALKGPLHGGANEAVFHILEAINKAGADPVDYIKNMLAQKKKDAFDLAPVGSEMMTGTGSFAADPDMKALISVTVSGVKQQALFSRLAEQKQ